ncbi:PA0069 family radical SAM protein [Mucisphaera calidilacus]|uniref:Radical SAM superfamily protein n=1 Tax=Mucisphaera calidilacus TaxID=2527982 RepID=A0A518BV69_9BACT|nr:PA0069 family radical SAM protein [Mucisphaera calidilacus]QDU70882.1 Radical SAM superfamily protein [Mucisphaera calidilacus]
MSSGEDKLPAEDCSGSSGPRLRWRGRGSALNPGNRFEGREVEADGETLDADLAEQTGEAMARHGACLGGVLKDEGGRTLPLRVVETEVFEDDTKSILNRVNSPDLNFRWTLNPYRGCEHGCVYCYARPDHEYLGFSSGLDFETKIVAKPRAAALLRASLGRSSWIAEPIALSGDTDCYQPLEAKLRLTRACLEVMAEARQPVSVITKSRLVLRDVDLLSSLNRFGCVHVAVSLTTLDPRLSGLMEPRAASPAHRLETIRVLSEAGLPVAVMTAPVVPGLNDRELPSLLEAAAEAGARSAGYVLLRLPHQIKALFLDWLERDLPRSAQRIESLIRQTRGGRLYDSAFGVRGRGLGPVAEQIGALFAAMARKHGLDRGMPAYDPSHFRRPEKDGSQGRLF